jgi:hypothetical protein
MRRAARTDGNHREIIAALRAVGCSVFDVSRMGQGAPDIVVSFAGRSIFLELKMKGETLTPMERDWHAATRATVAVVHSVAEAFEAMGIVVEGVTR